MDIKYKVCENYPNEGVRFIDFYQTYVDKESRGFIVQKLLEEICHKNFDISKIVVVVPEARGFVLGGFLADRLDSPLVMLRKPHKIPPELIGASYSYDTEYSKDSLEMEDVDLTGKICIFVDDVLATGGTMSAGKHLCEVFGAEQFYGLVIYDVGICNHDDIAYYSLYKGDEL